jgi:prevent-host-death family protein
MSGESNVVMVNVHQAKTQLSRLLARAEAGEEVVIARNGDPVARLVSFSGKRGTRRFGALRDRIVVDDSFFEPLPESELTRWES